ncbi:MAG: hypothetical protein WED81_06490 [Rhodothermales bacterium]
MGSSEVSNREESGVGRGFPGVENDPFDLLDLGFEGGRARREPLVSAPATERQRDRQGQDDSQALTR